MADKILEIQLFSQALYLSTQRVQPLLETTLSLRVFEINDIFNFHQYSRWQPKSRSQDKCVFAFYAEIQDGRQKWQESDFCEKPPVDSADNLQVRNYVETTLSQTACQINVFWVLCINSRWPPFLKRVKFATSSLLRYPLSDFCKMSPVHSADTLRVQNFVEIALSHTISEKNALLRFMQKFKMAAKSGGKARFVKKLPVDCIYPVGQNISSKSLYHAPFPR